MHMSLIFCNFMGNDEPYIAMKNQDEKLAKARQENERLRNEIHNLKRQVKRMKEKESMRRAELKEEQRNRKEEIMDMGMEDIKKKLVEAGAEPRAAEVIASLMSKDTGTRRK